MAEFRIKLQPKNFEGAALNYHGDARAAAHTGGVAVFDAQAAKIELEAFIYGDRQAAILLSYYFTYCAQLGVAERALDANFDYQTLMVTGKGA